MIQTHPGMNDPAAHGAPHAFNDAFDPSGAAGGSRRHG